MTVADAGYETAADAAIASVPRAMKAPDVDKSDVRVNGCDLHFTPGEKRLGGLRRYNALSIDHARASAVHLANSMAQAHSQRVIWVADHGGAAVITQAMQILVDRGVTLEQHSVHLYGPRTAPAAALRLAHRLKLNLSEKFADTGWGLRGALSQLSVAGARLKNKDDPYDKGYHKQAWINGAVKAVGPLGVASAGAMAAGASIPMLAGIVTVVGSGGVVYSLGQSLAEDLRHKLKR